MNKIARVLMALMLCVISAGAWASDVVERNGWLSVDDNKLVNEHGEPVQLRGVSIGWHCMWPRFYNPSTVDRLVNDWGADVVRCSIGLDHMDISYEKAPEFSLACVDSIVGGAVDAGSYVIVDFHSHANNLELARGFFDIVSKKYGHLPNVLYEVWNEPTYVSWEECKEYTETLIPIIRKNAPKSIIMVPSPHWDQDVHLAAESPITDADNLVYSLHFYAATHQDDLRERAQQAIDKGLPLFFNECASMLASGDGVIDTKSWEQWMELADANNISWVCWSISDKDESCSMLRPTASTDASQWTDADLKPWAVLVKYYLSCREPKKP